MMARPSPLKLSAAKQNMTHNYQYSEVKEDEIRLLWLEPATSLDAQLECKLSIRKRGPDLEYEAVSYVWGGDDGTYTQFKVLSSPEDQFTGNKYFFIRPNLVSALKHLRYERTPRLLWTDAVCINQDSDDEKSRQVPLMEKTYSQAKNVLVWLGEATETSKTAIDFMHTVIDSSTDLGVLAKGHAAKWDALESLLRMPWFTRRWIVQEIALAKTATIICGQDTISWSEFCDAVALFQVYHPDIKQSLLTDTYQYTKDRWGEVHALGACQLIEITNQVFRKAADGTIQNRLMSLESLISRLTMFEAKDPHDTVYAMVALAKDIRTVGQKEHTVVPGAFPVMTPRDERAFQIPPTPSAKRRKPNTRKERNSADLLRRAAHEYTALQHTPDSCSSLTGGRHRKGVIADRLYNVVKEAKPHRPCFRVDYNRSFLRVCMDFVAFTILQSGSVDIICRPWVPAGLKEEHNLPSWLTDVSSNPYRPKANGTFERVNGNPLVGQNASQLKWYNACGTQSRACRLGLENPDDGWGFGTFDRHSYFQDPPSEHRSLFVNGFVLDTVGQIKASADDGTIPREWFAFGGWKDRKTLPPDDFWSTLVADRDCHGLMPKAYYPRTLRGVVQNFCTSDSSMNIKKILATPQCDKTTEEVLNRVLEIAPNRRLFRTTEKTNKVLGLAPERAESGDLVCILAGCSVPVILREHSAKIANKRIPWYELLGDAYVHGFMVGDAVNEQEKRDIPEQQFELR